MAIPSDFLGQLPTFEEALKRALFLSVLTPVYNERHLVAESLRRVLALSDERIERLEVIVVDDHSTDGSWEIVQQIAAADPRVTAVRHERNRGKGAAIRTALEMARGEVCLVHDADLEYHPGDIPMLLRPFVEEGADAVFGSRYMSAPYRRVLMYRHSLINRFLTVLANWSTDLALTDIETCYKLVNTALLRSFPLRSNDFRFEMEVTMKLVKRRARIFEVPIRYMPRTYEEGKKIRARDGLLAIGALFRFTVMDDLIRDDVSSAAYLHELQQARRYKQWLGRTLRPWVGERVLELEAGMATLTSQFVPRQAYVVSDTDPNFLRYLSSYTLGKPYLRATRVDPTEPADFDRLEGKFDTVLLVNVLEGAVDPGLVLANARRALMPGGRLIALAAANPALFGEVDRASETRRRYTREGLIEQLVEAGFEVEHLTDFNRAAVPAWLLNGRLLRRGRISRVQVKALEVLMPLIRRVDAMLPWQGLSLIAVARPRMLSVRQGTSGR